MQVNSAQDYLTRRKRQILAATYLTTPPEQKDKTNSLFTSIEANAASQRELQPRVSSAPGSAIQGPPVYVSFCAGCPPFNGVFSTVNTKDGVNRQALMPIGVRATF